MEDVSDGLASEVTHICEQSKVGAIIFKDNIPIKEETRKAAKKDAVDYALYGGEDFELVFTVSEKNLGKVKGFLIGEITKRKGVYLYSKGKEKLIVKIGYDHFKV
jgi:thiamine-monophosphate kinase